MLINVSVTGMFLLVMRNTDNRNIHCNSFALLGLARPALYWIERSQEKKLILIGKKYQKSMASNHMER